MKKNKKISLVFMCHENFEIFAEYINELYNSYQNSTKFEKTIEFILIYDGKNTDLKKEIINEGIKILCNGENIWKVHAIIYWADEFKTDFIKVIDSDDVVDFSMLDRLQNDFDNLDPETFATHKGAKIEKSSKLYGIQTTNLNDINSLKKDAYDFFYKKIPTAKAFYNTKAIKILSKLKLERQFFNDDNLLSVSSRLITKNSVELNNDFYIQYHRSGISSDYSNQEERLRSLFNFYKNINLFKKYCIENGIEINIENIGFTIQEIKEVEKNYLIEIDVDSIEIKNKIFKEIDLLFGGNELNFILFIDEESLKLIPKIQESISYNYTSKEYKIWIGVSVSDNSEIDTTFIENENIFLRKIKNGIVGKGEFQPGHVTIEAYNRFEIFNIFPELLSNRYGNILYIDFDVIINGRINPEYFESPRNIGIQNSPREKIKSSIEYWSSVIKDEEVVDKIKSLFWKGLYFNSGVLFINNKEQYQDLIYEIKKYGDFRLSDQNLLNIYNKGRIKVVDDFSHNFQVKNFSQIDFKPVIIHYSGSKKPWKEEKPNWSNYYVEGK